MELPSSNRIAGILSGIATAVLVSCGSTGRKVEIPRYIQEELIELAKTTCDKTHVKSVTVMTTDVCFGCGTGEIIEELHQSAIDGQFMLLVLVVGQQDSTDIRNFMDATGLSVPIAPAGETIRRWLESGRREEHQKVFIAVFSSNGEVRSNEVDARRIRRTVSKGW